MARSGQAGSRSNNQYDTGRSRGQSGSSYYGDGNRGSGASRRSSRYGNENRGNTSGSSRAQGGTRTYGGDGNNRKNVPQPRTAIRAGQGILGWLGTMARWVVIIILIMMFIKYGKEAYAIGYGIFAEETVAADGQGENVTVTITAAMTVDQIGQMLEENGLLVDGSVFRYQERFSSYHGDIQPGTYTLSTDMTPTEILKVISEGSGEVTAE